MSLDFFHLLGLIVFVRGSISTSVYMWPLCGCQIVIMVHCTTLLYNFKVTKIKKRPFAVSANVQCHNVYLYKLFNPSDPTTGPSLQLHTVLPSTVQTHRNLFKILAKTFNFFMKSLSMTCFRFREVHKRDTKYLLLCFCYRHYLLVFLHSYRTM